MNRTQIEWVKNPDGSPGYTWNPITGCLNHVDGMCKGGGFPCYAYRLANGRLKERYLANKETPSINYDEAAYPFYPRIWQNKLNIKRKYDFNDCRNHAKPRGIFCCDMGDLFGVGIPAGWTWKVLSSIRENPQDRFYLLTKQPQNLLKFSPFPDNCWVGVTVCNDKMLDVAVDKLEDVQAKVKFISFEPLIEHLARTRLSLDYAFYYSGVSWVIIGAQTKPYKPPESEWVNEIITAADNAGIPVFLKNNLLDGHDKVIAQLCDKRLKQEMPKVD